MMTDAQSLDYARSLVEPLVKSAENLSGSRMRAYDMVARDLGRSAEWVRKLMGRQDVAVKLRDGFNIARAYDRLCERIETQSEINRRRTIAAGERINAALASAPRMAAYEAGEDRDGAIGKAPGK